MKRFNKMTEIQMTKVNGGISLAVTFPTVVGAILTVGATSAAGGAIGGAIGRAKNQK